MRLTYKINNSVANIGAAKTGGSTTEIRPSPTSITGSFLARGQSLKSSKSNGDE